MGYFLSALLRFFVGVDGKWVSLWWCFAGENVVRCVADVEKKQR